MEKIEDIRHTLGIKEVYQKRKETIEWVFADAKEKHGIDIHSIEDWPK